jgi:hypothetical protein
MMMVVASSFFHRGEPGTTRYSFLRFLSFSEQKVQFSNHREKTLNTQHPKKNSKKKMREGKIHHKKSALCKCQERVLSFTVGHQRERHTGVGRTFVVVVVVVVVCLFFFKLSRAVSLSRRKKERKRWAAVVFMAGKAPRKGAHHHR